MSIDSTTTIYLIIGIIIGISIGYLFAKMAFLIKVKKHRKHAVKQSSSVILGQVNEKIAPLLPNFPYHYKDLTFVGKGIDYIVFDGLAEKSIKQVVFLEIKSGKSQLNANERMIRDAINA